jgi:hypothetical protein
MEDALLLMVSTGEPISPRAYNLDRDLHEHGVVNYYHRADIHRKVDTHLLEVAELFADISIVVSNNQPVSNDGTAWAISRNFSGPRSYVYFWVNPGNGHIWITVTRL